MIDTEEPRDKQAHTFLSETEKEKLIRLAQAAGLKQSAYIRMLINQQSDVTPVRTTVEERAS